MAFPEDAPTKFDRARATAAVLAALVIDQGDAAGLLAMPADESARIEYLPARSGRHHFHLHLAALARLTSTGAAGVDAALRRAAGLLRRRGLIVVISDLYEDEAALVEIRRLARMGHDVVVIQIMARQELALPRGGAIGFVDLETGARLVTSPDGVAADYARNVEAFLRRVRQAVEGQGLDYLRLLADEPLEPALRRFLIGRKGRA